MIENKGKVLSKSNSPITKEDLVNELKRLREENDLLRQKNQRKQALSCKVSAKGGVSIYGFGRFPVTLYKEQWLRLIDFVPQLEDFIEENNDSLTVKQ